ncbi:hypothetical protein M0802_013067 [Mischocyttarus mexicanus]|nr:hypothetical protein M0802_013067 [Mischocyttarus mexicanus]
MGTYLCIASSIVPPRVSKRYTVSVHFEPLIRIPNQLVGAPVDSDVVLQCYVEASPQAMNTWYRDSGEKLPPNDKYTMSEEQLSDYSWQMNLTVKSLKKADFGGYICSTVNALGKAEGCVRLQESRLRKKPTTKERKKTSGGNNSNRRRVHVVGSYDSDSIGNEDDLGTTQIMAGSTSHEGGKTDRPLTLPSDSPSWIDINSASSRQGSIIRNTVFILLLLLRLMRIY